MSFSMPRAGLFILSAFFCALGAMEAGETEYRVPANAQVTRLTRFNLRYSLRDVVADGVQKVEFYITDDMGATWRLYGEDPDRASPMTIEVPGEGIYGFVSVATDRFGNREREPGPRTRPETYVIVDRTPPTAKWLAPTQNVLGRGRPVELKWESSDRHFGPLPVKIQYATDARNNHDRDAVWNTLQENLPAVGTLNWTPPSDASARYNFRLIAEDRAGNLAVAYNPATVVVDNTPPMVTGVSPLRSNQLRVEIHVAAEDPNGSGVKEISLYTTDNSGSTWTLVKEMGAAGDMRPVKRAPGQPIVFEAPGSGDYGLWPVVFDEAGNASALPSIGAIGPYVLVIDNTPPLVTLSPSFLSGRSVILANDSRTVEWNSEDRHLRSNSGIVSLSLDNGNSWQEIKSGLPTTGFTTINFPFGSFSEEAKLKVTVEDEFGNVGESVSETFKLSRSDTNIEAIGPAGTTPTMPQSPLFEDPYGVDSGPQPRIDLPGQQVPPPVSGPYISPAPYTPPPAYQPAPPYQPASPYPDAQPFPTDSGFFGGGVVEPQPPIDSFPMPSYPAGPVVGENESTAGPLPQAMLGDVQSSPRGMPPSPVSPLPAPPIESAPAAPPQMEWTPSTRQDVGAPSTPSWPLGSPTPPSPLPPSAPSGQATIPSSPWDGQASPIAPPPLAPPAASPPPSPSPAAPASPPSFEGFGGGVIAPPPLPSADSTASMPELPSTDSPGLSFDGWESDLQLPPLAGADQVSLPPAPAAPSPPPASSLSPPSGGMRPPGASPLAPPPASTPVPPPQAPAAPFAPTPSPTPPAAPPSGSPLDTEPAEIPEIPKMDDLAPPPIGAPMTARPSNPRQLSNHYADEAKAYLDEGRVDLALESATKSLNADESNPMAYAALAQAYVQQEPPNFARAATLAKEATNLGRDWYSWWTCADVFYRWAHARNLVAQAQFAAGQRPPADLLDERNQALSNAQIAIGNAAMLAQDGSPADREKVAITQGEIVYLRALTIPEPVRPPDGDPAAAARHRQEYANYKATVAPILQESLPYFQTAMSLGGPPTYREAFRMGIVNFRLGGLERETGNAQQATVYYDAAARLLEEAINASQIPPEGPREAYYMLAYCHDQLAEQPGANRARHKEAALRYWRQTAVFYPAGTAYRDYADQRIFALSEELGR